MIRWSFMPFLSEPKSLYKFGGIATYLLWNFSVHFYDGFFTYIWVRFHTGSWFFWTKFWKSHDFFWPVLRRGLTNFRLNTHIMDLHGTHEFFSDFSFFFRTKSFSAVSFLVKILEKTGLYRWMGGKGMQSGNSIWL